MADFVPISSSERWSRLRRWLQPGLDVKRWILAYAAALTLIALGLGLVLTHLYRTAPFPEPVYYVTLQFIPRLWRGLLFLAVGGAFMALATVRLVSSFPGVVVPHHPGPGGGAPYAPTILQ